MQGQIGTFDKLDIEKYPDMLLEYGRLIAWIGALEWLLQEILFVKGVDTLKALQKLPLGELIKKIPDAQGFSKILTPLKTLNKKRINMIHCVIGSDLMTSTMFSLRKNGCSPFTIEMLKETTQETKALILSMQNIIESDLTPSKSASTQSA